MKREQEKNEKSAFIQGNIWQFAGKPLTLPSILNR